jgi:ABC-2 type transport system permease protein
VNNNYSQIKAMLAIARASFRSITRSPSAVVFTIVFPLLFIVVFGFIGRNPISVRLGIHPLSDTTNQIYSMLRSRPEVKLLRLPIEEQMSLLKKGKIAGILNMPRPGITGRTACDGAPDFQRLT